MSNETDTPQSSPFVITGKLYDRLKFLAMVLLPALGTFYFTMGAVWHWPNVEQVIGTITALDTFLGVVLKISNASYDSSKIGPSNYAGHIAIDTSPEGKKLYTLNLDGDPHDLDLMKEVTFKIGAPPPPTT